MDKKLFITHGGQKLCALYRPVGSYSDSLVVMAHGGPGGDKHGPLGLFDLLAEKLEMELGLSSLRFDFRGYGESDGTPLDMTVRSRAEELGSVMAWTRERGYRRIALVAESLGASVALLGERPEVDVLALLWPALVLAETDLKAYFAPEKERELGKNGFLLEGKIPISAAFVRECRNLDLTPALGQVRLPTLIVHGDADRCVPVEQSRRACDRIPGTKKLVIVPGEGHSLGRPAERTVVLESVLEWLGAYLG